MARLTAITGTRALYNASASSLNDSSGNGYNLTASGSAAYETGYDGSANLAFNLDGTWFPYRAGDFGLTNASNITIQCRVKIDTQPSNATFALFSFVTNDANGSRRATHITYIDTSGTKKLNYRHGGSNNDYASGTLTTGTWYAIALVIDYTNGVVRGYFGTTEVLNTTLAVANSGNAVGLQIGAEASGSAIPNGTARGNFSVDNWRITSTARSAADISNDFASGTAYSQTLSDTVVASDTVLKTAGKVLSQTLALTDTIFRTVGRTLADTSTLTASVLKTVGRVLADTLSLTDTFTTARIFTSGPRSPGTMANDASFGSQAWIDVDNAKVNDDTYATAGSTAASTNYLKATNYGFAIPTGATILGILVEIKKYSPGMGAAADSRARIVKGGTVGSADKSIAGFWLHTDPGTYYSYGGISDLWSDTWTPADINAPDFGFALSATTGAHTPSVDHMRISVTYSTTGNVLTQTYTETVTTSDTFASLRSASATLTETLVLTASMLRSFGRTLSDTIVGTDTFTSLRTASATFSETIAQLDSSIRSAALMLSETVVATETLVRGAVRALSEAVTTTDTFTYLKAAAYVLTETITATDTLVRTAARDLSETFTTSDTMTALRSVSATLTETIVATASFVAQIGRSFAEAVTTLATLVSSKAAVLTLSETLTATAAAIQTASRTLSETISATANTILQSARTLSEVLTGTDTVDKGPARVLSETMTGEDTVRKTAARTLSDTFGMTDLLTSARAYVRTYMDTLVASDTFVSRIFSRMRKGITQLTTKGDTVVLQSKSDVVPLRSSDDTTIL
jgi:hypothetical protein